MALNVTFNNKFNPAETPITLVDVGTSENDASPVEFIPDDNSGEIALGKNQFRFIWARNKNCEIGITATEGAPHVQVQLTGSKWKFTNIGTNTSAQVDVGPDGQ